MFDEVAGFRNALIGRRPVRIGLGLLRAVYGLYWLYAASWKIPPDFGRSTGSGLWHWITQGARHPTFAWYESFLRELIIPNFILLGYFVLFIELVIALSLIFGVLTRLGTILGIAMSINIMLTVANVPGESLWFYVALITLHLLLGITRSGRILGYDARLAQALSRFAASGSPVAAVLLRLT